MTGEFQMTQTAPEQYSAPSAAPAPAPTPAPAPQAPVVSDEFSELRRLSVVGAERMGRAVTEDGGSQGGDTSSESTPEQLMTLPAGLVNNTVASQLQAQQTPQAQTNQPTAPGTAPATQPDQAEQQALAQTKITLRNAQGQEMAFENDQLVNMLLGYQHYENQISNIQNDFNQRYQGLEAERQRIAGEQAKIDSLMKSEKGFILEALEQNPEFAESVANLIATQPELLNGYQNQKIDAVSEQNAGKVAELEQKMNEFLQQQEQVKAGQRQAYEQAARDQAINSIQTNVAKLNEQLQVPARAIDALTAQAVMEVQAGRLPFNVDSVTNWFANHLQALSLDLGTIKNQVRGEYLQQKRQAPPPPPAGGGAPSPVNTSEMSPGERVRLIASQLSQATNGKLR